MCLNTRKNEIYFFLFIYALRSMLRNSSTTSKEAETQPIEEVCRYVIWSIFRILVAVMLERFILATHTHHHNHAARTRLLTVVNFLYPGLHHAIRSYATAPNGRQTNTSWLSRRYDSRRDTPLY